MDWSGIGGKLISGFGSSLFGGIFNGIQQRNAQKFQHQEAELQRDWQANQNLLSQQFTNQQREAQNQFSIDTYNNYQSPQALAKQYMEAGLNPRLAMGNGSGGSISAQSGSSGSAPMGSGSMAQGVTPPYMPYNTLSDNIKLIKEAESIGLNTDVARAKADAEIKEAYYRGEMQELLYNVDLQYLSDEKRYTLKKLMSDAEKADFDAQTAREFLDEAYYSKLIRNNSSLIFE